MKVRVVAVSGLLGPGLSTGGLWKRARLEVSIFVFLGEGPSIRSRRSCRFFAELRGVLPRGLLPRGLLPLGLFPFRMPFLKISKKT